MKENQFQFRKMEAEDIPAVASLENQLFTRPWSEQAFLQAMEQDTLFVVVLDGSTIVGYSGMYCSLPEGEITNVAVAPSRHRQGIGRMLLSYLLKQAEEKGICRIILEVRISNRKAIGLYKSMGFQNCGIRRNFYEMPREDGIVMVLEN